MCTKVYLVHKSAKMTKKNIKNFFSKDHNFKKNPCVNDLPCSYFFLKLLKKN